MEIMSTSFFVVLWVGVVPLVVWILLRWNDLCYALPISLGRSPDDPKLPPGYMGIPFLGEMPTFLWYFKFLRSPDEYINSKRHRYGDGEGLYRTHIFGSPAIIAISPSANKFVLQNESMFSMEWPSKDIVGATSLVVVEGASHTRIRNFVLRAINQPEGLRHVALMVQPRIVAALSMWAQKGRITLHEEAKKVTFTNIGKYFANFEPGPVLDSLNEYYKDVVAGFRAYPLNFPGTAHHRALKSRSKATKVFREEMERRRQSRDSIAKHDLLEGLMQMKDEDGKQLNDIEVLDNIVSLVIAGYTSTSLSISWAVYYLAKYPNVLQKLRDEHTRVAKKLNGKVITYDEIQACTYTKKVVEEIIRLANIAAFVFRTAKEDVDYKGYKIPKGWKVVCWLRYLHQNPEHFEDPMCFNPDRWNKPPKPGAHLVFGGGARVCAGNMLARLQVAILLHHLVIGYRWKLVNPKAGMMYLPHPIPEDGVQIDIKKI